MLGLNLLINNINIYNRSQGLDFLKIILRNRNCNILRCYKRLQENCQYLIKISKNRLYIFTKKIKKENILVRLNLVSIVFEKINFISV